jgi:hypothetical protein
MQKVLVISSTPYSNSNRGIDILCNAYVKKGYTVDHCVFPASFFRSKRNRVREDGDGINQIVTRRRVLGYYERYMHSLPENLIRWFVNMATKFQNLNFDQYSVVVIESGKPIMLIDRIPRDNINIVYRQSDPMKLLSDNKYMWELEKKVCERASLIYIVRESLKEYIPVEYHPKVVTVVNGFNVENEEPLTLKSDVLSNYDKHAVYLGYTPIDFKTVDYLCEMHKDVFFNIIGDCLKKSEINKLRRHSNFKYYGPLSSKKYLPIIKFSDYGIMPFKDWTALKHIGLNSKFLLFMKYGLAIVSYYVGETNEFSNIPIIFCGNKVEFSEALRKLKLKSERMKYDIDFGFYSAGGRMEEYLEHIL